MVWPQGVCVYIYTHVRNLKIYLYQINEDTEVDEENVWASFTRGGGERGSKRSMESV